MQWRVLRQAFARRPYRILRMNVPTVERLHMLPIGWLPSYPCICRLNRFPLEIGGNSFVAVLSADSSRLTKRPRKIIQVLVTIFRK